MTFVMLFFALFLASCGKQNEAETKETVGESTDTEMDLAAICRREKGC